MKPRAMRFYTSDRAARICGLAPSTIRRCVKQGQLRAFRTPGGNIRILPEHLQDFMLQFQIPLHRLDGHEAPVVLVGVQDPGRRAALVAALHARRPDLRPVCATREIEILHALGEHAPAWVILEADTPERAEALCRTVRQLVGAQAIRIGLLLSATDATPAARDSSADLALAPNGHEAWAEDFLAELLDRNRVLTNRDESHGAE